MALGLGVWGFVPLRKSTGPQPEACLGSGLEGFDTTQKLQQGFGIYYKVQYTIQSSLHLFDLHQPGALAS